MKRYAIIPIMCLLGLAPAALHADLTAATLLANSPFLHADWNPSQSGKEGGENTSTGQYAFRGVFSVSDNTIVNLSNNSSGKTYWLGVGKDKDGISVLSYDKDHRKVTISVGGRELTLDLEKPKSNTNTAGIAVNSLANKRLRQSPFNPNGNRRFNGAGPGDFRNIPPPPPWLNKIKKRQATTTGKSDHTTSSSGNTGEETDPGNEESPEPTTTDPSEETDPDTNAPPPPPSFVPQIPSSLQDMINSGNAPQ